MFSHYSCSLVVSLSFFIIQVHLLDIRMPPTILSSPLELKIYRSDDEITLECNAAGTPQPQYEWKKDGRILSNPSNIYRTTEGSIQIRPLTSLDEGHYQCVASSMYGTAVSRTTVLQRAVLSPYPPGSPIHESQMIQAGQPHMLRCNPTKCVPKATYSWAVAKTIIDDTQLPVILSKRIQIDDDGQLYFSYVTMADAQDNKLFKCNMYNPYLDLTMGGSYSRLNISPVSSIPLFPPTYAFSSPAQVIALEGHNITLRCFFSGNPEPSLQWAKRSGSLPIGRHQITNYNTDLTIRDVQKSDEGDYYCRAANPQSSLDNSIQIDVQAVPVFRSAQDRPHSVNMTEGQTIIFSCIPYADPVATIVWMRNGEVLDATALPRKYRFTDDRRKLVISDLCKDCEDGTYDLAVIQCNASNVHGYAFGDGYVNVLKKTTLFVRPVDVSLRHEEVLTGRFDCAAKSDDSTSFTIRWFRVRQDKITKEEYEELVYNNSGKVILGDDGSLSFFLLGNTTDWSEYTGEYRCKASNGYSEDVTAVRLDIDGPITLIAEPIVGTSSLSDWWWIFVVIALILLLLILIICCCICLQRNKGDSYPVDEKERKNGNNPEKELVDVGFHDYQRPETGALKGSRGSLNSSIKMESDSEASLNEYGDIDAGKFTEDGSFIGNYSKDRRIGRNGQV